MDLCDLNLECWIYRTWDTALEERLPYLTGNAPSRMRMWQIWEVMEDITSAVAFIHEQIEVHRDMKPRNGTFYR